jgi:glycosyltransferase involved in cell wall biosynthesis
MLIAKAVFATNDGNLPLVLDLHENRPEIMKYYPHLQSGLGKLLIKPKTWNRWQNNLARWADRLITVTSLAKDELVKSSGINPEKVIVVPNTIRKDVFYSYQIEQSIIDKFIGRKVILYLGDTGLRRGTDTAVEAMHRIKDQFPEVLLVLVGNSRDDNYLLKQIEKFELEEHVLLEGWQDLKLFPSYISAATMTLSPLKRNLHHDTTYANKVFQYMAFGKPVIVSDCPAQAKLIEETNSGLVFEAENVDELAKAIISLVKNPALADELGANGKAAVNDKYDWQNTSTGLLKLYAGLNDKV